MDKKKILVVDDDQDMQKMLRLSIEASGYEFMSVSDGAEMLKAINTKTPDLILLDVMLPNMDGYTALREMRKEDKFKDLPVIVLTGKEQQKVGDLFALEEIAHFVEKPFDSKDLMGKIKESING